MGAFHLLAKHCRVDLHVALAFGAFYYNDFRLRCRLRLGRNNLGLNRGCLGSFYTNLLGCHLLGLNNDETPIYTAGYGYSDELPAGDFDGVVRPKDMWCWAQAQEMAQVSPEMHEEFVFQYEKRLLAPFGLTGYGCCEDLTRKLRFVLALPNLRRVSICPWANVESCAEQIGSKVIFMWKPQPAMLVGTFNATRVRAYIRRTVDAAHVT